MCCVFDSAECVGPEGCHHAIVIPRIAVSFCCQTNNKMLPMFVWWFGNKNIHFMQSRVTNISDARLRETRCQKKQNHNNKTYQKHSKRVQIQKSFSRQKYLTRLPLSSHYQSDQRPHAESHQRRELSSNCANASFFLSFCFYLLALARLPGAWEEGDWIIICHLESVVCLFEKNSFCFSQIFPTMYVSLWMYSLVCIGVCYWFHVLFSQTTRILFSKIMTWSATNVWTKEKSMCS